MSKKLFSKIFVFLLVVGLLFAAAPTGQAQAQTTLCVNTDGAGGCYTSIQSAITAASAGDTITVAAGTYTENITINKALTLQGAGRDSVTLTGITTGDSAVVSVSASDVTIHGFSFQAPVGGKKVIKIIAATSGFHFLDNRVTTADNLTNLNGYAGLETDSGFGQTDHVITGNIFVSNHTS